MLQVKMMDTDLTNYFDFETLTVFEYIGTNNINQAVKVIPFLTEVYINPRINGRQYIGIPIENHFAGNADFILQV